MQAVVPAAVLAGQVQLSHTAHKLEYIRRSGCAITTPTWYVKMVGPKPIANFVTWMPRETAAKKWPASWIPTAADSGGNESTDEWSGS